MFSEDDLIPISALQHFAFCERQCALIHIEKLWEENSFTAEGNIIHDKAHGGISEFKDGIWITRSIPLKSLYYGLCGYADVVDFLPCESLEKQCVELSGLSGLWKPFPVEYKRGKAKKDMVDEIQLCAQVFCLEEMLGVKIDEGALFYGKTRHRLKVMLSADLRSKTSITISGVRKLLSGGVTPRAVYEKKCERCSLKNLCLPSLKQSKRSYSLYMAAFFKNEEGEG